MSFRGIAISQHGQLYTSNAAKAAVSNALQKTQVYGVGLLQASTPVRTGAAKAAWSSAIEGKGITWRNSRPYVIFLEKGTRHMSARPILAPNLPKIQQYFNKTLVASIGRKAAASIYNKSATPVSFDSATSGYRGK